MPNTVKLYVAGRHHFPCDSTSPCFDVFNACKSFRLFRLFQLFNIPTIDLPFSPFYSPNPYRPSLVASNTLSDPPKPLFTSVLYGRSYQHRCRQILTSREEILAPAPAPVPPTTLSPLATTGYGRSYWPMEYTVWHAQCDGSRNGNEGIAFLSFLWATVTVLLRMF